MHPKTDQFSPDLQELATKKTCVSGSIASELPLSRPTVCQHLQELKNAGLIMGEISGQNVCYCLHTQNIARLQLAYSRFLALLDTPPINCHC